MSLLGSFKHNLLGPKNDGFHPPIFMMLQGGACRNPAVSKSNLYATYHLLREPETIIDFEPLLTDEFILESDGVSLSFPDSLWHSRA